ncbi:MAG: deoxyribodipyrimidine photo-lyase [Sphingobacteriales bacterium JAD_PAG50586_3]|nr:MAG: deoxyribodipyrimidine photo-lyase [Sphingobacteriales bacterium JAD_PAG50586_3]
MHRALVWFKTDLRLHDNETLVKAIEQANEVVPVYIFNPADYITTEFDFAKTGSYRAQFIIECVAALAKALQAAGSGLIVKTGNPVDVLPELAAEYNATKVFAKKEVSYEEKLQEEQVEAALWKVHCTLETYSTSTLYHAEDLPFSIKDIPDVFTSFRKKIEKESTVRPVFNAPEKIASPTLPKPKIPTLKDLGLKRAAIDTRAVLQFTGGEDEALKRVNHYFLKPKLYQPIKKPATDWLVLTTRLSYRYGWRMVAYRHGIFIKL